MRLPIPIFKDGEVYKEINLVKPKNKVLADTKKISDTGDFYSGIKAYISGCTESLISDKETVTDFRHISSIIMDMPYRSAVFIAVQISLLLDPEDGVEGIHRCPRCHKVIIAELTEEKDTRDFIRDLTVTYMEDHYVNEFTVTLKEPVVIKVKDEGELLTVESMTFRYSTLKDCIIAFNEVGLKDEVRFQNSIYANSLLKVNNETVDEKFIRRYGTFIFENIQDVKNDLGAIKVKMEEFGLSDKVKKICTNQECGKVWYSRINPSNFFVSALHSI